MSNQLSQDQINRAAWAACDTFRGALDPANYKDYILTMLFVKYMSDLWLDMKTDYEKRYAGDKVRVERALARERFIVPEVVLKDEKGGKVVDRFPATYYSLYERRDRTNIGELINITLERIEEANKEKLENVFRNIDFNSEPHLGQSRERNRRLKSLLEDFHREELNLPEGSRRPPRHSRQHLRILDREFRGGCREEGGGVLHPGLRVDSAGQAGATEGGRPDW